MDKPKKKPYSKPQIIFEDFSLCTNIAAGCEYKANSVVDVCSYSYPGGFNSFTFRPVCMNVVRDDGLSLKPCYYIPTSDDNIFNS